MVDRAVRVLRQGGCDPVVVVLGAWVGEVPDAVVVVNPQWETGMGSSLRVGLEHLLAEAGSAADADAGSDDAADRVVVTLVDLPGLTGAAVARLLECHAPLAAAAYAGTRGHPVLIAREHWGPLCASAAGDEGAKHYLATHGITLVEVGDLASGDDMDEPA